MLLLTENINKLYGATFPVSIPGRPRPRVLGWFLPGAETLEENRVGGELRTGVDGCIEHSFKTYFGGLIWGGLNMISSLIKSLPSGGLIGSPRRNIY